MFLFAGIASALPCQTFHGIGARHLHQTGGIAPLRHIQPHLAAPRLAQQARKLARTRGQLIHGNALRDELVVLQIIAGQKLLPQGGDVLGVVKQKLPFVHQTSLSETQNGRAYSRRGAREGHHILLVHLAAHHLLAPAHLFNGCDLIPDERCTFEIQPFGCIGHALAQQLEDLPLAAPYHMHGALHSFIVVLPGDFSAAHGHAPADVRVQAGTAFADILGEFFAAARQAEHIACGLHHFAHGKAGGIRADVIGIVVVLLQRGRNARVCFPCHLHIAVSLVVLQ